MYKESTPSPITLLWQTVTWQAESRQPRADSLIVQMWVTLSIAQTIPQVGANDKDFGGCITEREAQTDADKRG